MRGRLQNFAKAAILAIAQQNCSIDDALPCKRALKEILLTIGDPRDGALLAVIQESIVNIR